MRIVALVIVSGCTFGGGPTIGVSRRGWFGGAELSGGPGVQAAVGYQTTGRTLFARADVMIDPVLVEHPNLGGGGRVGVGVARSLAGDGTHLMLDLGAGVGKTLSADYCPSSGNATTFAAWNVFVDVRYAGEWQIVMTPRLEGVLPLCSID
jgi:hypothetical protein